MTLRVLPSNLVNQIAAGEVVERPAAALKELVENALDASSSSIAVHVRGGGKTLISVQDNGIGMTSDELSMAVERHTTSKLDHEDLWNISTFGFRGEALPSIGAVSRLKISSRPKESEMGWSIQVEGGSKSDPEPVSHPQGTHLEIRDLFFATPARLKFLKTDQTEISYITDTMTRLAMAHPNVSFSLKDDTRELLSCTAVTDSLLNSKDRFFKRIQDLMGREFAENTLAVQAEREGLHLWGLISLPTLHRGNATHQYLFVNKRPVKDRLIQGAIRDAYQDLLPSTRHPMLALFLEVPNDLVDVNVHPAKTEIRFRETGLIRGFVVGALKATLASSPHQTSTALSDTAIASLQTPNFQRGVPPVRYAYQHSRSFSGMVQEPSAPFLSATEIPSARSFEEEPSEIFNENSENYPLGAACAQLHETYIIAQTPHGIVIIDQHAAHERLIYEKLKYLMNESEVPRQSLLIPEVIDLNPGEASSLLQRTEDLEAFGLLIEGFGGGAVLVREVPALLGNFDIKGLITDLVDELKSMETSHTLKERVHEVCSSMACRGSIRAGKKMNVREMNALLREMEQTPFSDQCNHGRPTHVTLKLPDIERLFGRR